MTLFQVNVLNIGLMIASLGVALVLPFELFLFSYAVLGPLHYLTEISWLHDRTYFLARRSQAVPLVALTLLIALTSGMFFELGTDSFSTAVLSWGPEFRFGALALAGVFVLTHSARTLRIGAAATAVAVVAAHYANEASKAADSSGAFYSAYDLFFLLLLTTIIHVYVFTGAFVVLGALRSRSVSGFVSLGVFVACSVACFLVPVREISTLSDSAREAYDVSATMLNLVMARAVDVDGMRTADHVFSTPLGVMTARLIAYAYTYHYLNWFSKTSVIKWHDVPRARLASVVAIWLGSLGLYAWDFVTGLSLLFFLSMLHVLLEFPLNWRSFMDIGSELRARVSPARG